MPNSLRQVVILILFVYRNGNNAVELVGVSATLGLHLCVRILTASMKLARPLASLALCAVS